MLSHLTASFITKVQSRCSGVNVTPIHSGCILEMEGAVKCDNTPPRPFDVTHLAVCTGCDVMHGYFFGTCAYVLHLFVCAESSNAGSSKEAE